MNQENEKISFTEAIRWQGRSWKVLGSLCPSLFISGILYEVSNAAIPLVEVWLSARILNELASERDPRILFRLVVIQLVSSAVLAAGRALLLRWKNYEEAVCSQGVEKIYIDKMIGMDFENIDSQYVYDTYSQICQSDNWGGWGLKDSIYRTAQMAGQLARIVGGVGLSVTLFASKVPVDGGYGWLNHPLCLEVILGILLFVTLFSFVCSDKANGCVDKASGEIMLSNRFFAFFGNMCTERERAADLRVYEQQENVCNPYMERMDMFRRGGVLAKTFAGPMGLWNGLSASLSAILTGAVYLFVCMKAWAGVFGVGSIAQYVGAITSLFLGLTNLLRSLGVMRFNAAYLKNTFAFLDIPDKMYQGSRPIEGTADNRTAAGKGLPDQPASNKEFEIEFRDVSFKYPGSQDYALRHVTMAFKMGRRTAVVGMNGSGKTTFIKLLCRMYDPTEGQILLNGVDIRQYRYSDYIRLFSVVFQDFVLFALPLGENVAGVKDYDRERVKECLEKAGFSRRLDKMPDGLDTYLYKDLDKEGVEVSGGEAQKIAIARTLYKDAPFVILDEPTAALDPVAEMEIYSKFNDIIEDKTAVYISHRLSSCQFCDEILVFDQGRIVQRGSHQILVADTKGKYCEMWTAQAQYYQDGEQKFAPL